MKSLPKKVFRFELIGFILATTLGSLLHFVYEWSGNLKPVGLIAAVNESTWEHLKLGFWPLLLWGIYEYVAYGKRVKNFFLAKTVALYSFCILVPAIFYSYSSILGRNYLILDISTFVVSVALGQFISYKVQKTEKDLKMEVIGKVLLIILFAMFISFTFFPPKIFLFKDPVSGGYGFVR